MPLSEENKNIVLNEIFERAYELESRLAEQDYFLAKIAGLKPEEVSDIALKLAIKEMKETFSKPG